MGKVLRKSIEKKYINDIVKAFLIKKNDIYHQKI